MKALLNSTQLKYIAVIFMIFDHIYSYLLIGVWPEWCTLLARFVAPLFLFLLVQGFHHTSNKKRYLLRLIEAASVTLVGEVIINLLFHRVDPLTHQMTFHSIVNGHNIFITLAIFFGILWNIETFRHTHHIKNIVGIILLSILSLFFEGGFYLLPLLFIFEWTHAKSIKQYIMIALWCALLLAKAIFSAYQTQQGLFNMLCFDSEWMMISVIPFIMLYNGKYGRKTQFSQSFFYWIYPIHLWILMIIAYTIHP